MEQQKETGFPTENIDKMVDCFNRWVNKALKTHCQRAKPSPYIKRWWNKDFIMLRKSYTYWRNRNSALRRQRKDDLELHNIAAKAKKLFHRTIWQHRKLHWNEFLSNNDNIWKVLKYLDLQATSMFTKIPLIKKDGGQGEVVTKNHNIARELLQAFFPVPLPCEQKEDTMASYNQLPWEPIAKHEVNAAVFRASPDKALGRDGLPAKVWQELWPVLSGEITTLFTKSLETGKVPHE